MKIRTFTFTFILLFVFLQASSQIVDTQSIPKNVIFMNLVVEDSLSGQKFKLEAEDIHFVSTQQSDIYYRIHLSNHSRLNVTSYFKIACDFDYLDYNHMIFPADPNLGATAPVIIPPVKKKKVDQYAGTGDYPYVAEVYYPMRNRPYKVTVKLQKYPTQAEYLNPYSTNYIVKYKKTLYFYPEELFSNQRTITTYPNPVTDNLIIQIPNTVENNHNSSSQILVISVFNKSGTKVMEQTLAADTLHPNKTFYHTSFQQLPHGNYIVQFTLDGKMYTKTIVKN